MKPLTLITTWIFLLSLCGCEIFKPDPGLRPGPDSDTIRIPVSLPYTVSLKNPVLTQDSLQSFCFGQVDGYWLIFGGRTNGFHGTGGDARTFPVRYANEKFIVYQPATQRRWEAPLPPDYAEQFSSTNMPFLQDGNLLWVTGGYGCIDRSSRAPCYRTYDRLNAIDLPGMVTAIVNGKSSGLDEYIASISGPRFQVTGGAIQKVNDHLYLAVGQNYDTIYVNGITGQYTEEIRRFSATVSGTSIQVTDYQAFRDPQFHRRDLNVTEAVRADGSIGFNILAGVFQPNAQLGAPWPHPIRVDEDGKGNTRYEVDDSFSQQFNAYDCGNVLLFDPGSKTMYTTLLGGITNASLDANGKVAPPTGFLPWSKYVSTVAQFPDGTTREYPQAAPLLPGFVGASGEVILHPDLTLIEGTREVIDYSKLPAGDNLVGWLFGGIESTAEQTDARFNPSFSSAKIYEIHLQK